MFRRAVLVVLMMACCARAADESSCKDWDIPSCSLHDGCTVCTLGLRWAKASFCFETDVAAKLPSSEAHHLWLDG